MARPIAEFRRPEIIEALKRTLATQGVNMPSNDDIAKEAGMSRQLVRHYFPDQMDMALALAKTLAEDYQARLSEGVTNARDVYRLDVFLDFYFAVSTDGRFNKPQDDQVYDALFALAAADDAIRDELKNQYSLLGAVFSHELHLKYPKLTMPLCQELAETIVAFMYGHWKMVATLGISPSRNKIARETVERIIHSYVTDPPQRNLASAPEPGQFEDE